MSLIFAVILSSLLHGGFCHQPLEPAGTQIHVNGNGNAVIATDLKPAHYICTWYGNWVSTGVPVR